MKAYSTVKIEWTGIELDELVWKFSSDKISWGSELVVKENQLAALFTGHHFFSRNLKMHDFFRASGNYTLSQESLPLLVSTIPDIHAKPFLEAIIIFCSTKEQFYSGRIYTGDSLGQATVSAEADTQCRFRISNAELFFNKVVANHKRTSDNKVMGYLRKTIGDELFRQRPPYNWTPKQYVPLEDLWRNIGIELIDLKFDNYKQGHAAVGV